MYDNFEKYDERKGMWFWMMLSIGAVISADPDLSAKKTDHVAVDFIESEFFRDIFADDKIKRKKKFYG